MKSAVVLQAELHTKQEELAKMFKDARQADGTFDFTADQLAEVNKRNDELGAKGGLSEQYEQAVNLERIADQAEKSLAARPRLVVPGQPGESESKAGKPRDFDRILHDSGYSEWQAKSGGMSDNEVIATFPRINFTNAESKTLIELSGISPSPDRQPIVGMANAVVGIDDLILQSTTNSNVVNFYEQTTETDNTAAHNGGTAVTDNVYAFTLRSATVGAYSTWIPATRDALSDNGQLLSFIQNRLPLELAKKRTLDLIDGSGVAPIILGLMRRTNVQTQAKGADPTPDAIFKAMTLCAVTGDATPTAIIMHPNDWQDVRLLRTVDGIYIWGSPADSGPNRMWGLTVRVTPQAVENTAVVFSGPMFELFRNGGTVFEASTEHGTYWTERSMGLLMEERYAFVCYRGQAVVKVTGI